jgi:hypothetical protein
MGLPPEQSELAAGQAALITMAPGIADRVKTSKQIGPSRDKSCAVVAVAGYRCWASLRSTGFVAVLSVERLS